jgi:alpha-galactosidase
MANIKIVIVGGGSWTFTPGLVTNIMRSPYLEGCHVVLHDIDPDALDLSYRLTTLYKERAESTTTFAKTLDQAEALDGADYVLVTISTGGLETMEPDITIPEKYGIIQPVGDTVGPGGLSRALRSVPVFLRIGRAMEERCPDAWMLNLSNPLSALTRVVNKETSIRALGLCIGVWESARGYARFFDVPFNEISFVNTGIDHISWFTEVVVEGRPAYYRLHDMGIDDWLAKPPDQARTDPTFGDLYDFRVGLMVGRQIGALPAIGDRHLAEALPTFLQNRANFEASGIHRTTIADRRKRLAERRANAERMVAGQLELDLGTAVDVLGTHQSNDVAGWITALEGAGTFHDNVNGPNIGQIPELPLGAVVETRAVLDGTGFRPLVSPMPREIEAMVRPQVLRQELTVEAAIEGSFDKALAVLVGDPLVADPRIARPMLEELIEANRRWLPQFDS